MNAKTDPMRPSCSQALVHAWKNRDWAPNAVDEAMDVLLAEGALDTALHALQLTLPQSAFDALLDHAHTRAEQCVSSKGGVRFENILIGLPVMGDIRSMPVLSSIFWECLSEMAQELWHPTLPNAIHFRPVGPLIKNESIANMSIKGWQRLLRDGTAGADDAPALDRLLLIDQELTAGEQVPSPRGEILLLTQRIQLGVLSYNPLAFSVQPSMVTLFHHATKNGKDWKAMVGEQSTHSLVTPPQRLRGALAVALQQFLEAAITIAQMHRQLPLGGDLEWIQGTTTQNCIELIPKSGGHLLDPINVSGQWLNAVGPTMLDQILRSLTHAFKSHSQTTGEEPISPRRKTLQ